MRIQFNACILFELILGAMVKIQFGQPIDGWKNYTPTQVKVVGVQHRRPEVLDFIHGCELANRSGHSAWVSLRCEPANRFDSNAVKVLGHWQRRGILRMVEAMRHIGYLPADLAAEAAPLVAAGKMRARLMSVYMDDSGFSDINIIPVVPRKPN